MKRWIVDKLLPAIVMGIVAAAVHTYIEVQMLRRDVDAHQKQLDSMRAEVADLWSQANASVQALEAERHHDR